MQHAAQALGDHHIAAAHHGDEIGQVHIARAAHRCGGQHLEGHGEAPGWRSSQVGALR
jgi:hypothetical protein